MNLYFLNMGMNLSKDANSIPTFEKYHVECVTAKAKLLSLVIERGHVSHYEAICILNYI